MKYIQSLKLTTALFLLVYFVTLCMPLMLGCTYIGDTLYWIKVRGFELTRFNLVAVLMFIAPVCSLGVTFYQSTAKIKVLLILFFMAIGGFSYFGALASAWHDTFLITENMILYPGCVIPPLTLSTETLAAIAAVWIDNNKKEMLEDERKFIHEKRW